MSPFWSNRNRFLNSQPVLFYNTEHLVHTYASHSWGICQSSGLKSHLDLWHLSQFIITTVSYSELLWCCLESKPNEWINNLFHSTEWLKLDKLSETSKYSLAYTHNSKVLSINSWDFCYTFAVFAYFFSLEQGSTTRCPRAPSRP